MYTKRLDGYSEMLYKTKTLELLILWDNKTCWLTREQLASLFQLNEHELNALLKKARGIRSFKFHKHCRKISVITIRKFGDSDEDSEWIRSLNHYDLFFIQHLQRLHTSKHLNAFIRYVKSYQKHLQRIYRIN